ncbi:MAG: hypothetical protein FWG68_06375 [Defluviitaleaceae bacterium]|nr:hypothetical protein [Defluviitaleaceae bacterium]
MQTFASAIKELADEDPTFEDAIFSSFKINDLLLKKTLEIAKKALKKGFSVEEVASLVDLPIEKIEELT